MSIEFNQLFRLEEAEEVNLGPNENAPANQGAEGDSVWLIITGEVRFTTQAQRHFTMKEGFLFFLSGPLRSAILEAMTVRSTVLLRLGRLELTQHIQPHLERRSEEIVRGMHKSRYFSHWHPAAMLDVAANAEVVTVPKGGVIYSRGDDPGYLYLVKEGVVLLERTTPIVNQQFASYEHDHDKNPGGDNENTLIVRKSMPFGVDGLLIKQGRGRLYHAKVMGACELYVIKGEIVLALEGGIVAPDPEEFASSPSPPFSQPHRPELLISTETPQPLTSKVNSLPTLHLNKYTLSLRPVCPELRTPPTAVEPEKRENVRLVQRMEERVRKLGIRGRYNRSCWLDGDDAITGWEDNPEAKNQEARRRNPVEVHIQKALSKEKETKKKLEFLNFRSKVHESLKKKQEPNLCFSIKSYKNVLDSAWKSVGKGKK